MDKYYSKVIKTFIFLIKRQFTDRQTLLINTTHSLKFLEEYADRQAQIWKVLQKYHNLPDDVDLHSHFDSFKSNIKSDFKHLKEAMSCNVQNIQTSLGIQQTYIHPLYVPTLTTFTINCLNCRSISNITVCIHTKLIQCRLMPQNMIQT